MSRIEKPSVLLIDDNEPTRTLMTAVLHREFDVHAANDGFDALEQLKTRAFAAIVLDLRMPQLDGFGVLEFLQQQSPDALRRVLVVTAALSPRDVVRAGGFGIRSILPKPFDVEALLNGVRECAGSDGSRLS